MALCTLVTAFYPIRSKFSKDVYIHWAQNFLQLSSPIVLFTTADMEPLLRKMRGSLPIHIVVTAFEQLYMWKLYKHDWRLHHTLDSENLTHTPELYTIWAQKPVFVQNSIEINPFQTDYFYWCDIGAFRTSMSDAVRQTFPKCAFPHNKILFTSVNDLDTVHCTPHTIDGKTDRIVGGLWGGHKSACLRWRYAYEAMLIRYFATNRFAGKDQTVMLSAYLDDPTLAEVVRPSARTTSGVDDWFFAQRLLSDEVVGAQKDMSYVITQKKPIVSVYLRGGLGNQMFQIATAYTYAKTQSASLDLLRIKVEEDGRSMYWDTVLSRFTSFLTDEIPGDLAVWWERSGVLIPPILENGILLQGYYQSSKYFNTEKEEIRRMLKPDPFLIDSLQTKYAYLFENKERVVVVHARRTDYLKNQESIDHHGPLAASYYCASMEAMGRHIAAPIFLLTSDDNMFWLDILPRAPMLQTYPFIIFDEGDVYTLAMLQQFHYFILANSSFSWWSAWLADARHVIAPRQWFGKTGPKDYNDIYEPTWIRM